MSHQQMSDRQYISPKPLNLEKEINMQMTSEMVNRNRRIE